MADAIFEDPRLAAMYDALDPDRSDLDVYRAIADELGARRVLDVGPAAAPTDHPTMTPKPSNDLIPRADPSYAQLVMA